MVTSQPLEKEPLWQKLKHLVDLDHKQQAISSQIKKIEQEIQQNKLMLPKLHTAIDEIKNAIINAKKNVDLQELNAKDLKEQEKNKRAAIDNVKNQKQYEALKRELSSLLQQISEQDDTLVKAWHNLDLARKKEESELDKIEEKITELQKDMAEKQSDIEKIKENNKKFEQEKKEAEAKVPKEWLVKYERMRSKVSNPIVPIINDSCSSCYYSVPPQDVTRLKNNAILLCRSCYRLLYYDKEEEQNLKEASF